MNELMNDVYIYISILFFSNICGALFYERLYDTSQKLNVFGKSVRRMRMIYDDDDDDDDDYDYSDVLVLLANI